MGQISRTVVQLDGTKSRVKMEVKYVPGLLVNLFSLTQSIKQGAKLGNQGVVLTLTKGSATIKFDKIFETMNGYIDVV